MILQTALSASQALELDELLWTVLWKSLGLDRDVRLLLTFGKSDCNSR